MSASSEAAANAEETVLVTGGSGFLGQHLIKALIEQRKELRIREIRSLDIVPYENRIGHCEAEELRSFVGDITAPEELDKLFASVTSVFHCAAYVSIEYPPDYDKLQRVNIDATRAVVQLCVKHNVKRLVYTSCASVCFVPFKGKGTFSIVINQTESKAATPRFDGQQLVAFDNGFLIPGYSASKLRAENIVLNSNGVLLDNKIDYLSTCALRPPLTYGECDIHFIPKVFAYLAEHKYIYPRIAGAGGKHQIAYAGNVAWAHICALKTLKSSAKAINGLPVFVTDETAINDVARFVQKMSTLGARFPVKLSRWYLPHFVFYFLAFLYEFFVKLFYPLTKRRLNHSPRAISSYMASVILYSRLRASIHMDYEPIIESDIAAVRSANWYADYWDKRITYRENELIQKTQ